MSNQRQSIVLADDINLLYTRKTREEVEKQMNCELAQVDVWFRLVVVKCW